MTSTSAGYALTSEFGDFQRLGGSSNSPIRGIEFDLDWDPLLGPFGVVPSSAVYTYTRNGRRASVTDANGNTTGYRYDAFDRLEFTDYPNTLFEQLSYDRSSNVVSKKLRSGEVISFGYDVLDRMTEKAPSGSPTVTYGYDLTGRLKSEVIAGVGATTYDYDEVGRLESKQDPNGRVVGTQYDASGNRSRVTYPDGSFVTYEYDELNRLETIRDAGTLEIASYIYDALSRRLSTARANGTSTTYDWEVDDDLGSLAHAFAGSTATWDYAYDAVHSRMSLSVSDPQFLYDLSTLVPTTYENTNMNQHSSATIEVFPEPIALGFAHDANGNMASTLSHAYGYDAEGRLTTAELAGGNAIYTYDPTGLRTSKSRQGTTTEYVLDGGQVLAEYDGSGALLRRYVYAGLDEPVRMTTASGDAYFYHADGLGSVVALSDDAGNLVEAYAYGPYGETESGSSVSNPFRFTGREYDAESGLYYYRARHYDPELGRFLQPDPIGYADGLNLYLYVGANPINFVDPLGLDRGTQSGTAAEQRDWVNPTGGEVRGCDAWGCGNFGASRDGGEREHLGTDYGATPGQDVRAVTGGTVGRIGYPYGDDLSYRYIQVDTPEGYRVRKLYVRPGEGIRVGTQVTAGQRIGTQQPLQPRYPGITEHLHVDITRGGVPVNPETLIRR